MADLHFDGYLTVQQTAKRLGVARGTVWRHIVAGHLPTYRTPRNSRVRLIDMTDIEAIERVTRERNRVRKDWSGKDWADYLIEAAANRNGDGLATILYSDIWPEQEQETALCRHDFAPVAFDDDE